MALKPPCAPIQLDFITLESSEFPLECDDNRPAGWSWRQDAPAFDIPNMDPVTALTFKLAEKHITRMMPHGVISALKPYIKAADERLKLTTESSLSRWPEKVRVVSRNLAMIPPVVQAIISKVSDRTACSMRIQFNCWVTSKKVVLKTAITLLETGICAENR